MAPAPFSRVTKTVFQGGALTVDELAQLCNARIGQGSKNVTGTKLTTLTEERAQQLDPMAWTQDAFADPELTRRRDISLEIAKRQIEMVAAKLLTMDHTNYIRTGRRGLSIESRLARTKPHIKKKSKRRG